jgi:hypothetical protein
MLVNKDGDYFLAGYDAELLQIIFNSKAAELVKQLRERYCFDFD